jgi:aminopeptidase C
MELLNKYIDEIKKDLIIDHFNIKEVQMRLPARKHFWAARLIDAKIKRSKLINDKKIIKKEIVSRIISDSVIKITTLTADTAAESTLEVDQISNNIKELDYIIEYLEKVEKIFGSMHWEIKNIIQIQQLEQL